MEKAMPFSKILYPNQLFGNYRDLNELFGSFFWKNKMGFPKHHRKTQYFLDGARRQLGMVP